VGRGDEGGIEIAAAHKHMGAGNKPGTSDVQGEDARFNGSRRYGRQGRRRVQKSDGTRRGIRFVRDGGRRHGDRVRRRNGRRCRVVARVIDGADRRGPARRRVDRPRDRRIGCARNAGLEADRRIRAKAGRGRRNTDRDRSRLRNFARLISGHVLCEWGARGASNEIRAPKENCQRRKTLAG
jgi:hypothetical protein